VKKITALIPCYNEAGAVADLIAAFPRQRLLEAGYVLDILVIDNNSQDKTAEIARAAGARVVTEHKQGKGHAVKTGLYNIEPDTAYVVMLDGDNTYRPEEMLRLIEPLDNGFAEVIIGSRMHGRIEVGSMKRLNHLGNRVYSRLVRSTYGVMVSDTLTGYFAWSREAVEVLRPHLRSAGFTIEMEMITKMARLGYKIYSVPVTYHNRLGDSSLRPFKDGSRILHEYFRNLRWKPVTGWSVKCGSAGFVFIPTNTSSVRKPRENENA
jgi:dolichol-phosphate hexosyltransferase